MNEDLDARNEQERERERKKDLQASAVVVVAFVVAALTNFALFGAERHSPLRETRHGNRKMHGLERHTRK